MICFCADCDGPQNFSILSTKHKENPDRSISEYTFAICDTCASPALFSRLDIGGGFEELGVTRLWPPEPRYVGYDLPRVGS
jgi:hypothetical protein